MDVNHLVLVNQWVPLWSFHCCFCFFLLLYISSFILLSVQCRPFCKTRRWIFNVVWWPELNNRLFSMLLPSVFIFEFLLKIFFSKTYWHNLDVCKFKGVFVCADYLKLREYDFPTITANTRHVAYSPQINSLDIFSN